MRERENREKENDFDDAYVDVDANVDGIVAIDSAAIVVAASVDVDFAAYHVVVAASGAAPPKVHKQCPRNLHHFGIRSPRRHCPFSSSKRNFLLDLAAVKPVVVIHQSNATIEQRQ